jgi:nitroreductase
MDALDAIAGRRSIGRLTEPAPDGDDLRRILEAAVAAPDHEELRPWRFVILKGEAKVAFGQVLADSYLARVQNAGGLPTDGQLEKERTKLGRAPLVIIVGAKHMHDTKVPWIEQRLAAGAAVENLLIAATALGYGSMWRTGDPSYDDAVKRAVGLDEHDAIVGFVYLGTPHEGGLKPAHAVSDADFDAVVTEWSP